MPQTITIEGRRISIPDGASSDQFLDILEREVIPPAVAAPLPDVVASERKFQIANQVLPPVAAPRPGMFDDLIPPLPPGYVLDKPGMFDDLIPPRGAQAAPQPVTDPALLAQLNGTPQAGPKLIPVDHDPFAQFADAPPANPAGLPPGFVIQPPPTGPRLIPVDHDPFAQFADAPPAPNGLTPGGVPMGPDGRPRVVISKAAPVAQSPSNGTGGPSALHSLAVGAQGVASGIKDTVLLPVDMMAGLQNAIVGTINKATGTSIPMATPASKMVESIAEPFTIDEKDMSPGEKLGYNVNRFGTQALGTGAMLAARAPAAIARAVPAETLGGRTLDTLARPYGTAPARTLTGDAIGGAGAGAAVNAVDNYIPDHAIVGGVDVGSGLKQAANTVAPLVGGIGANAVQGVAEGLGGMLKNMATRAFQGPAPIPVNPQTKVPYKQADADRAAADFQANATGAPKVLGQDIRENASALTNPKLPGEASIDASALPTSGLLSRDPGLVTMEAGARQKAAPDFIQRDQNVKEAAATRVQNMRDPDADLGSVFRRAAEARNERLAPSKAKVDEVQGVVDDLGRLQQDQGAAFGAIANTESRANASRRLDKVIVEDGYVPARAEKNRQFDTAPGRDDQLPADGVHAAIDRLRAGLNPLVSPDQVLPAEFVQRLDRLRPRIIDGENVGGPGTASGGQLADLRKYLNFAQTKAQKDGNFDLSDNLRALRRSINDTINAAPGYAEANANYSRFADRYRPAPGDEMAEFTKKLDRAGNTDGLPNRGTTPPSETAGRFLSVPEKATALRRVFEDAPDAAAGNAAVRDYMMSDFARSALNSDGTLNPARSAGWANQNAAVLSVFPALEREFGQITQTARQGRQLSADAREGLERVRADLKANEAEIDRSIVGTLLREDPRDVASKLLGGKFSAEKKLDEVLALVKNDAPARRGWKAAVTEVLTRNVQGARQVGETPEVQLSRLSKEFKDNEALLAKTFSPEEMNGLRQTHKLLGYFKEAEKRGAVVADNSDKWSIPGVLQLGARHLYGDLKGGGVIKRFKLLLEQLPTNKQSADEIVHMAWFNPDVAAYLLERPIKNANVPAYNINLRRLLAADNAARESGDR